MKLKTQRKDCATISYDILDTDSAYCIGLHNRNAPGIKTHCGISRYNRIHRAYKPLFTLSLVDKYHCYDYYSVVIAVTLY
ncbi:Hypothetical predicted protein [Octopus vulgaris]|uniref:Uncharacterized protein n=1 Tax=Octopus vulgaris TaxID=6645 RepID=A0AA36BD28_OCTVU|nr:Hypothetical predicted protein [Octopus vulgaris]